MPSGTLIGFVSVGALLLASIFLAILDRMEKGNPEKSKFLSRMAIGLFVAAFLGGAVVTLLGGIRPRTEGVVDRMRSGTSTPTP